MKLTPTHKARFLKDTRHGEQASIRVFMLALVSFLLGIIVTVFWFHRTANSNAANPVSETTGQPAIGLPAAPSASAPSPAMVNPPPMDPAVIDEVKQKVTDYASIPEDEGENILRAAALKEFAAAAKEMDNQVEAAQQQLVEAQNSQSAADQQAAMKDLQDAQAAGAEKLKKIAARLQAQIAALKSLKSQQ
jgi:hypothetical protein